MATTGGALGAALQYIEREFGGLTVELDSEVTTGAVVAQLVGNDPDALALTMVNLGANPVYITPDNAPSTTRGIILAASGGFISMIVRDDLTLPTRDWWGVSPAGAADVYIIRVRRYRQSA